VKGKEVKQMTKGKDGRKKQKIEEEVKEAIPKRDNRGCHKWVQT